MIMVIHGEMPLLAIFVAPCRLSRWHATFSSDMISVTATNGTKCLKRFPKEEIGAVGEIGAKTGANRLKSKRDRGKKYNVEAGFHLKHISQLNVAEM